MFIQDNVPLGGYSTMRLGGNAAYLTEVSSNEEVVEAVAWAKAKNLPVIMVGEGSNIFWRDEGFNGLVLVNRILGYELRPFDETSAVLTVGAGENWDSVVERTVNEGYYSLAPLSLIPGTAGATPVQNVGAYGEEVSNCLMTIQAYDIAADKFVILRSSDCNFAYRTSRFKTADRGKFLITSLSFSISKQTLDQKQYEAIKAYLIENNLTVNSAADVRQAVIAIRTKKLPDPKLVANNGSFFANPIISEQTMVQMLGNETNAMYWHLDGNRVKVSAAWLIEKAGFKDYHDAETGMATWASQPLVLVNEHAKSTADLLKFRDKLVTKVQQEFGITLEQEPELLP
jgi:UDP-N-acetylmuramate dehydrogenase